MTLSRSLALTAALCAALLAGCGVLPAGVANNDEGRLQLDRALAAQIAGWPQDRFEHYRVYYQGRFERPRAVVLELDDDRMRFARGGWGEARGGYAPAAVRNALAARLIAAPVRSPLGRMVGYAFADERDDNFETRFYRVEFGNDGVTPTYRLIAFRSHPMRAQGTDGTLPGSQSDY